LGHGAGDEGAKVKVKIPGLLDITGIVHDAVILTCSNIDEHPAK
jgi:hypothetical protein